MRHALLVALVAAPTVARGDVWQRAADPGAQARRASYTAKLEAGDAHALRANVKSISISEIRKQLAAAEEAYRAAATAEPREGEPYYRIGRMLYSFYFECTHDTLYRQYSAPPSPLCIEDLDPSRFDRKHAKDVIDAWDAFEERAPLDPRLSVDPALGHNESEILFKRAILRTKLVTKEQLAAAAIDYEKYLARADSASSDETVWGNLAETYMMLGRLDEAIDTYREALRRGWNTSTMFGLAVALDRENRGGEALDLMVRIGKPQFREFQAGVMKGNPFFVPQGEKYYYFALAEEALGMADDALEHWRAYISSGAHPEFQPRAKAHVDRLIAERKKHPARPPPLPDELPY